MIFHDPASAGLFAFGPGWGEYHEYHERRGKQLAKHKKYLPVVE
jgi:hypothetical protein